MAAAKQEENLWLQILNEQRCGMRRLVSNKSVLIFGDNGTGKTSLLAKLKGKEPPKHGAILEYDYLDVRDEGNGDKEQLGVWIMNGDPGPTNLLSAAFNENNFGDVLVMLTVSMTEPWAWPEQLKHWMHVLERHIKSLPLAAEKKVVARKRLATYWQSYCCTGLGSSFKRSMPADDLSPLTEGALATNLGVDIVVVVTKTDCMAANFQMEHDYYDEHFDFIQQWIRKFCLRHGAALFYTSIKKATNCDSLRKYLLHRIYGLPFQKQPVVADRDAVLVPAGWDTLNKIDILFENMHHIRTDGSYADIIKAPSTGLRVQSKRDSEFVETVDEQAFLARQMRILQMLDQAEAEGGGAEVIYGNRQSSTRQSSSIKTDHHVSPGGGEGVLAKFFTELLQKKSASSSGDGPESTEKLGMPLDPGAELGLLSRIFEKKADQVPPEQPQQNTNKHD